jgi:hypothetical protein
MYYNFKPCTGTPDAFPFLQAFSQATPMARECFVSSSVKPGNTSCAYKCTKQYQHKAKQQHAAAKKRCCKVRVKSTDVLKDPQLRALLCGKVSMELVQEAVLVSYWTVMQRMSPIQAQWMKHTLHSGTYALEPASHQPTPAAVKTMQHSSSSAPKESQHTNNTQKSKNSAKLMPCPTSIASALHQQSAAASCTNATTIRNSTALLIKQVATQVVMAPAKPMSSISINLAQPQQSAADSCIMKTIHSNDNAAHQQLLQQAQPLTPAVPSQTKLPFPCETAKPTKTATPKVSLVSTIMGLAKSFISWVDFDIEVELSFNSWS